MARKRPTKAEMTEALDSVANALAAAAPLSTRVRQQIGVAAEDAVALEGSIDRAVRALRRIQPTREEE